MVSGVNNVTAPILPTERKGADVLYKNDGTATFLTSLWPRAS